MTLSVFLVIELVAAAAALAIQCPPLTLLQIQNSGSRHDGARPCAAPPPASSFSRPLPTMPLGRLQPQEEHTSTGPTSLALAGSVQQLARLPDMWRGFTAWLNTIWSSLADVTVIPRCIMVGIFTAVSGYYWNKGHAFMYPDAQPENWPLRVRDRRDRRFHVLISLSALSLAAAHWSTRYNILVPDSSSATPLFVGRTFALALMSIAAAHLGGHLFGMSCAIGASVPVVLVTYSFTAARLAVEMRLAQPWECILMFGTLLSAIVISLHRVHDFRLEGRVHDARQAADFLSCVAAAYALTWPLSDECQVLTNFHAELLGVLTDLMCIIVGGHLVAKRDALMEKVICGETTLDLDRDGVLA